jgi:transposase
MGAPYGQDLRDRILAAYDRGMTSTPIAKMFAVSVAWAKRVKQRRRETGQTTPKAMGGKRVVKVDLVRLRDLVVQQPDATLRELHQRLGCACSESAVDMALRRLGLSFKKRRSMPASRTVPTSLSVGRNGKRTSSSRRRHA